MLEGCYTLFRQRLTGGDGIIYWPSEEFRSRSRLLLEVYGEGEPVIYITGPLLSDILWRMRLRQVAALEFCLQEAAAMNTMQKMPPQVQHRVKSCAAMLSHVSSPWIS